MDTRFVFFPALVAVGLGGFVLGGGGRAPAVAPGRSQPSGLYIPNPGDSLFYIPMSGAAPTQMGLQAYQELSGYLNGGDTERCRAAIAIYDKAMAVENFGGEYSPLKWFCEYAVADEAGQAEMVKNPDARRFVDFFSPNDWQPLRDYLGIKYGGAHGQEGEQFRFVDELIRFNSPARPDWEGTDEILRLLDLKPGQAVGDIGAGAGFFSFRFSDLVGATGKVYSVELNPSDIRYMSDIASAEGRTNMQVLMGPATGATGLAPGSVDVVFLCSTYQTIYVSMREDQRQVFLASLKAALRPGGRVVISDNEPNVRNAVPYRGISISPLLVKGQLEANGFHLVKEAEFIPQRYLLVFER